MRFVFDMDGTLVDSRRAVKEAYKAVGVKIPDEAWGKPWYEWGVTSEQHDEKVRLYPSFLRQWGRRLPACDLLQVVQGYIITSASLEATRAVQDVLDIRFDIIGYSMSETAKITQLTRAADEWDGLIYVDDNINFGRRVAEHVPGAFFLHVTGNEGVFNLWRKKGDGHAVVQRWVHSGWTDRPFIESTD